MPLSSSQFGDEDSSNPTPEIETPLALGKNTAGSAANATAWRNKSLGRGRPMAYSKRTAGSTYNFDDSAGGSSPIPKSDSGASFGRA
jgi:hypothetical protein